MTELSFGIPEKKMPGKKEKKGMEMAGAPENLPIAENGGKKALLFCYHCGKQFWGNPELPNSEQICEDHVGFSFTPKREGGRVDIPGQELEEDAPGGPAV